MYFVKDQNMAEFWTSEKMENAVKSRFPDREVLSFGWIDSGCENNSAHVRTSDGPLLVRISSIPLQNHYASIAHKLLEDELRFMEFLRKTGIPTPEIYRRVDADISYDFMEAVGQIHFVTVMEFMPGQHLDYSPEMIQQISALQVRMHEAASAYQIELQVQTDLFSAMTYRMETLRSAAEVQRVTEFPKPIYEKMYDVYVENAERLKEYYSKSGKLLIHCDLKADNLLMSGGRISGVIDFGDLRSSVIAEDLGVFLWDLCNELDEKRLELGPFITCYFDSYRAQGGKLSFEDREMAIRYAIDRYLNINLYYLVQNQSDLEMLKYQTGKADRQFEIVRRLIEELQGGGE